jgi:hypothetical protein
MMRPKPLRRLKARKLPKMASVRAVGVDAATAGAVVVTAATARGAKTAAAARSVPRSLQSLALMHLRLLPHRWRPVLLHLHLPRLPSRSPWLRHPPRKSLHAAGSRRRRP